MILGLLVDVLIAAKLGISQSSDSLIIGLSPLLFLDTVGREVTRFSMMPVFIEKHMNSTLNEYARFTSATINLALIAGIVLFIIIELSAFWIVSGIAPGLSPAAKQQATLVLRISSPTILFTLGSSVLSVYLNSQKLFTVVALRNAAVPIAVTIVFVIAWSSDRISSWIALSYNIGFVAYFIVLYTRARIAGYTHQWSAFVNRDDFALIFHAVSLPTIGFLFGQGSRIVERLLASLATPGGVASYYFAFRIFTSIQKLVGMSIATTSLPDLANRSITGDKETLTRILKIGTIRSVLLATPVTLIVAFFNEEIVHLIFGRGTFDSSSVKLTSSILFCFSFGLFLSSTIPVLQSALYAQKAYNLVLRSILVGGFSNIVFSFLLSRAFDLQGIAIGVSISVVVSFGYLIYLLLTTGISILSTNRS